MKQKLEFWSNVENEAKTNGSRVFLVDEPEVETTFAAFWELSGRVYRYVKQNGIACEDVVLVRLPRSSRIFAAIVGVLRAGATFVCCEDVPGPRLDFVMKDCEYRLAIDETVWEQILATEPLEGAEPVDLHDMAYIAYTSGTTGNPKGCIHEYGTVLLQSKGDYDADACLPIILPLDFTSSYILFMRSMTCGRTLCIVPQKCKSSTQSLITYLKETGTNCGYFSPSFVRMNDMPDLGWKQLALGSEPADGIMVEGLKCVNMYASTESAVTLSAYTITEPLSPMPIGYAADHLKVLRQDGTEAAPGEPGELCFRQPYFRGYLHFPEKTAQVIRDGWVHSGDRAILSADGTIAIYGRIDEQFKIGGYVIQPEEIQNAMRTALGLRSVIVRGFVYKDLNSICAFYTDAVEINQAEAHAALLKLIPLYMIPTNYIRMQSFPMLPTGKVDKSALLPPEGSWAQFAEEKICEAPCLGQGRTAAVYRLGAKKVVKLFDEQYPLALIVKECVNGMAVHEMGVPCPKTFGIVRTCNNHGIMMESFEGCKTFEQALEENFDRREELIRLYVRGIRQLHSYTVPEGTLKNLQNARLQFTERAEQLYGKESVDRIRKVARHIPHRNTLLQLDCHIGNCFVKEEGPVFFDFAFGRVGHPILDLFAMYGHLIFWPPIGHKGKLSPEQCRTLFDLFLREYLNTQDDARLANAERQLRCVHLTAIAMSQIESFGIYSEAMTLDALEKLKDEADWFEQQELIE